MDYSTISELLIKPDPFIKTDYGFIHTSYSLLSYIKIYVYKQNKKLNNSQFQYNSYEFLIEINFSRSNAILNLYSFLIKIYDNIVNNNMN